MKLRLPSRLSLANFPTRVQRLDRVSRSLFEPARSVERGGVAPVDPHSAGRAAGDAPGPWIYVKRDDETGADLSGNKVRKLEFLLAEALAQGADIVLTCGGIQSNHCRATAVAARRVGLDSRLFLRGEAPVAAEGNVLLDAMVGAELRFITPEAYTARAELMAEEAESLRASGRRPYVIPEGGSNALGSLGYVAMLEELRDQGTGAVETIGAPGQPQLRPGSAEAGPVPRDAGRLEGPAGPADLFPWNHIVCATGSGGTLAGLLLGAKLLDLDVGIWGVNVCDSAGYFQKKIVAIADELRLRWERDWGGEAGLASHLRLEPGEIRILEGYKGPAYAQTYPEEVELIREVAREDGLLLDPVYTGKAFYGLLQEARQGRFGAGERVLFLHTGGVFSLFAYRDELLGGRLENRRPGPGP